MHFINQQIFVIQRVGCHWRTFRIKLLALSYLVGMNEEFMAFFLIYRKHQEFLF